MFTQKHVSTKKGFTLIELMVVIVIIGILAAIAIPKLFGMSAKAKASEVGPAVGTWSKMQLAYKMEKSQFGDFEAIGYQVPGEKVGGNADTGFTSNFGYKGGGPKPAVEANAETSTNAANSEPAFWRATMLFTADVCNPAGQWKAEFGSGGANNTNLHEGEVPTMVNGCQSLTPSFCSIGKCNQ